MKRQSPHQRKRICWAIIGGGNGGQSVAGHLGIMGFRVRLFDIVPSTIDAINMQGGIHVEGEIEGFGQLELASTNLDKVVNGADIVMVITPAIAHAKIAKSLAPLLQDKQVVVLHPGATFGALEFKKTLENENCRAKVTIAETSTLIYACRSKEPGHANILGIKNRLLVAAIPGNHSESVCQLLHQAYPQVEPVKNVLITSLDNTNPIVHPGPILFNVGIIEKQHDWRFYLDGITPTIGLFLEKMDAERIAVGKALGLNLWTCKEQFVVEYDVVEDTLCETVRNNRAYMDIMGPDQLETRYLLEDIPMGLVPLAALGKSLGVPTPHMDTIIKLGELLLGKDLTTNGRTLQCIGLLGMNSSEICDYVDTGERKIVF